jgi:hypothetical protein
VTEAWVTDDDLRRVLAERPVLIEAVFVNDLGDAVSSEADRLLRSSL